MTLSCTPSIINNTIARNSCISTSSSATGAGICAYSGSSCAGINNIIYYNVSTTNPNISGTVVFTYTCCGTLLNGTGNTTSAPLFVNTPPTGYFFLSQIAAGQTANSPCVDAGDPTSTMVTGSTRTDFVQDEGIVDMGFHWAGPMTDAGLLAGWYDETTAELEIVPDCPVLLVSNYPNPFNPSTTIRLLLENSGELELIVYDITGRVIETLYQGAVESGLNEFTFSGASLPSGVYFYQATINGTTSTGKALLVK
jgi:hypothetical protein